MTTELHAYLCAWNRQELGVSGSWLTDELVNEILVGYHRIDEMADNQGAEERWVLLNFKEITVTEQELKRWEDAGVLVTRRDKNDGSSDDTRDEDKEAVG